MYFGTRSKSGLTADELARECGQKVHVLFFPPLVHTGVFFIVHMIDGCCFYYYIKHSSVALLDTLSARIVRVNLLAGSLNDTVSLAEEAYTIRALFEATKKS